MRSLLKIGAMPPPSGPVLWAGGSIMLWLFYAFVFTQTTGEPVTAALVDAGANVLPLAALAAAAHALLKAQVMPRTVPVQLVSHAGLAIAFATTWYALVLVFLAFFDWLRGHGFTVSAAASACGAHPRVRSSRWSPPRVFPGSRRWRRSCRAIWSGKAGAAPGCRLPRSHSAASRSHSSL